MIGLFCGNFREFCGNVYSAPKSADTPCVARIIHAILWITCFCIRTHMTAWHGLRVNKLRKHQHTRIHTHTHTHRGWLQRHPSARQALSTFVCPSPYLWHVCKLLWILLLHRLLWNLSCSILQCALYTFACSSLYLCLVCKCIHIIYMYISIHIYSSALQCVAVCCSVSLPFSTTMLWSTPHGSCVVVCCSALCCSMLQCIAVRCSAIPCASSSSPLQGPEPIRMTRVLQCVAVYCSEL